jgi:hypothetical protein
LHNTKWSYGKKKKRWKSLSSKKKNKSIHNSVGTEKSGYAVPEPNKTMINVTKEPCDTHIKTSKKKSWEISLRNSWRGY